jgi:hypothetical protein
LDVDVVSCRQNVSVALPADLHIDVHDALISLEMGLLPITQFNGKPGAQDQELRLDFVTSAARSGNPVHMPNLNIALEPLKFMEFSLQGTTQGCVLAEQASAS